MKFLVVEDDQKIKVDSIDDAVASLDATSDWAQNQQEAVAFLKTNDYDQVLLDLQIPSRPGGKPLAEFGKNTLRHIHEIRGKRAVPVTLMKTPRATHPG